MSRPNLGDWLLILAAVRWTVLLSVYAFAGGAVIGLAIALMRTSANVVLEWIARVYIWFFQGTPLLMQLFLIFFGSDMIGLALGAQVAAALGLSLNAGAFLGEIWRGSIQSVPRGQVEAARALGVRYRRRMQHVVLPQALRVAIPPTVGFLVNLIKSTSLASIVGFVELTQAAKNINSAAFRPFLIFGVVALIYFALCWPLTLASRRLERRLALAYRR